MNSGKKILFVTDRYYPKMTANAICAHNLINVYLSKGFEVDLVFISHPNVQAPKNFNNLNLFPVKPNARLKFFILSEDYQNTLKGRLLYFIGKMFSIFSKLFFFLFLPLTTIVLPHRYYSVIKELTDKNDYYAVVSILQPLEASVAISKLKKKKLINIPWIVFCVDTFVKSWGNLHQNTDSKHYKSPIWYKLFLKYCDGYLFMASRLNEYEQKDLAKWNAKLCMVDLPMLTLPDEIANENITMESCNDKCIEKFGYFGSLGGQHYDYHDLLNFFFSLPNDTKRELHLFTRGCNLSQNELVRMTDRKKIINHGYVDAKTMRYYIEKMDYLVSLKYSDQISAKTFQYISYCKPIIHFSGSNSDPNVRYLRKYPLSFIVDTTSTSLDFAVEKFLKWKPDLTIDINYLKHTYELNTPTYCVSKINDFIERFWYKYEN